MLAVLAALLAVAAPQPTIVQKPIPFPAKRKQEMAAYARHYGIDSYRLRDPKVIVEHYTVTSTFQQTCNTFAPDARTRSCASCPGTCAHYVIDRDGTIYQLVPRSIMCRHTVGLNYTAIGIEHVGFSDGEVLRQRAPDGGVAAAHALAALPLRDRRQQRDRAQRDRCARRITASASSGCKTQTHGDWSRASMRTYRSRLAESGTC